MCSRWPDPHQAYTVRGLVSMQLCAVDRGLKNNMEEEEQTTAIVQALNPPEDAQMREQGNLTTG